MTLALDLGSRGIPVVLLDKNRETTANPRCNTANARSMEYFRRFGIADRIRRTGLPLDHTTDMVYTTSLSGWEVARFEFSSAREVLAGTAPEYAEWPTPELQHRISQIYLEPVLDRALRQYASVRLLRGYAVETVTQDSTGVDVVARHTGTGEQLAIRGAYVAGCDGGASSVRRSFGISLAGDPQVGERRLSIYFRSHSVKLPGTRPGWRYLWRGERYHGAVIQLDGSSLYLCHARVADDESLEDANPDVAMREAMGYDIPHEKLDVIRWIPRRLVADQFRIDRVILAGDAAHVWLPDGGFGMNTGIADSMGLGWRLAAIHAGWGTVKLLDDYTQERRSVGEATSEAAKTIGIEMLKLSGVMTDPRLREDSEEGARVRGRAGELIQEIDRKQWNSKGVQLGSAYIGSPGVSAGPGDETATAAIDSIDAYVPSVNPGSRLPHYWTNPRVECVFDLLGQGMTLLSIEGESGVTSAFEEAALTAGVPATVVNLPPEAAEAYTRTYVLVRPDWYVAWSGDDPPADWGLELRKLCGHDRPPVKVQETSSLVAQFRVQDPFEGTSWAGSL